MFADAFEFNPIPTETFADPMDSGTVIYNPDVLYGGSGHDTMVYPDDTFDPDAANQIDDAYMPADDGYVIG